jgi:hypothetical protein
VTAQPAEARRRVPLLVWVGAALLLVTLIGASKALPDGSTTAPSDEAQGSPDRVPAFGHVTVPGDPTPLHPLQMGKIVRIAPQADENGLGRPAAERFGAVVEAGTPLLWVDDTVERAQVRMAEADVAASRAQLHQAQLLCPQHAYQKKAQADAVEARKREHRAADEKAKEVRRLADKGLGPTEADARAAEAQAEALAFVARAEQQKLAALDDLDPQVAITRAEQELIAKLEQLRKAQHALEECVVRAPSRGSVLRCNVTVGEALGPNPRQPALMFCPDVTRVVRTEVEQEFARYVFVGQTATIEDDTRTSPKHRGRVTHVSDWFAHRRNIMLEPLQFNDVRTLECLVEVEDKSAFRIGQRVRVTLEPKQ